MKFKLVSINDQFQDPFSSKLGGSPWVLNEFDYPKDRTGKEHIFWGQINLAQISFFVQNLKINCPNSGLIQIYSQDNLLNYNPKDRSAFKIVFFKEYKESDFRNISSKNFSNNSLTILFEQKENKELSELIEPEKNYFELFSDFVPEISQIAAFSANGISWNKKRSIDSCYQHLVEDSLEWLIFAKFCLATLAHECLDNKFIYLLIRKHDLALGKFELAQLVIC